MSKTLRQAAEAVVKASEEDTVVALATPLTEAISALDEALKDERLAERDRDYNEFWQSPAMLEWAQHVISEMAPKLKASAMAIQLMPGDTGDVKFWVELGASIMMDKPIIAVAVNNRPVPAKMLAVADEVVMLPEGVDAQGSEDLTAAISNVLKGLE